jgi:hypothetical protein
MGSNLPGASPAAKLLTGGSRSTLLARSGGGGEAVEGDGLAAQGAGVEDESEHDLQFVQDLV